MFNIEALVELLDDSDASDQLTQAEIMRELGRFDEASGIFAGQFDGSYSSGVALMRELVETENRFVTELPY